MIYNLSTSGMTLIRSYYCLFLILSIATAGCMSNGSNSIITESGLIYEILEAGTGEVARVGDAVMIEESVTYRDGTLLFSTDQTGRPVRFEIGANQAIDGIDEGVRGMQVGEVRKLTIPTTLSQREAYPDVIAPDSILVVELKLVEIL